MTLSTNWALAGAGLQAALCTPGWEIPAEIRAPRPLLSPWAGTALALYQKHVYTSAQRGDRKSTGLIRIKKANHSLSCLAFSPLRSPAAEALVGDALASAEIFLAITSPAILRLFPKLSELGTPQVCLLQGCQLVLLQPSPSRGRKLPSAPRGCRGRDARSGALRALQHTSSWHRAAQTAALGNNGEKAHPVTVIKCRVSSPLGSGFRKPNHVRGKEKKNLPKHG